MLKGNIKRKPGIGGTQRKGRKYPRIKGISRKGFKRGLLSKKEGQNKKA